MSSRLQLDVAQSQSWDAPSGECLRGRGSYGVNLQVKQTVPECEVKYINPLPLPSFVPLVQKFSLGPGTLKSSVQDV